MALLNNLPFQVVDEADGRVVGRFADQEEAVAYAFQCRADAHDIGHYQVYEVRWVTGTDTLAHRTERTAK